MHAAYGSTPTTTSSTTTTSQVVRVPADGLPVTGADVVGLGLWGAALMLVAAVVLRSRRWVR